LRPQLTFSNPGSALHPPAPLQGLKITLFNTVFNSKNNGVFVNAVEPMIIKILANLQNLNF
jgi:hypothetical protein